MRKRRGKSRWVVGAWDTRGGKSPYVILGEADGAIQLFDASVKKDTPHSDMIVLPYERKAFIALMARAVAAELAYQSKGKGTARKGKR